MSLTAAAPAAAVAIQKYLCRLQKYPSKLLPLRPESRDGLKRRARPRLSSNRLILRPDHHVYPKHRPLFLGQIQVPLYRDSRQLRKNMSSSCSCTSRRAGQSERFRQLQKQSQQQRVVLLLPKLNFAVTKSRRCLTSNTRDAGAAPISFSSPAPRQHVPIDSFGSAALLVCPWHAG
jgi:hypothetical protein